jgi:hypothetical protein
MTFMYVREQDSIVVNAGRLDDLEKEAFRRIYLDHPYRRSEKNQINARSGLYIAAIAIGIAVTGFAFVVPYSVARLVGWGIGVALIIIGGSMLWLVRRAVREDKRQGKIKARISSKTVSYPLNGIELMPLRTACDDGWDHYKWEITARSDVGIELTGWVIKFLREREKPMLFERKLDGNREKARKDEITALAITVAEGMNAAYTDAQAHTEMMAELARVIEANEETAAIQGKQAYQSANETARNQLFDNAFGRGSRPLSQPRVVSIPQ